MIFIELVRANEMSELEILAFFQFEKSHFQHARGLMTFIELMRASLKILAFSARKEPFL